MAREVQIIGQGFSLLEAPRWRDGHLYVSDFYNKRVLSFAPDGTCRTVAEVEGMPSGLGWDPQGRLLVVSMMEQKLLRLADGALEVVADLAASCDSWTNDMVVDDQGRAYIGNFGIDAEIGRTSLVRVDPDGSITKTGGDVFFPNGSCITPDGRTLLLAETFLGRISEFDIEADGSLSNRRVWAAFGDPGDATSTADAAKKLPILPDGMCLDAEGCLWVACPQSHSVYRVRKGGEILEQIDVGPQSVYAAMLGGEDGRTLYLCCAAPVFSADHSTIHEATLRSCRVDVPGVGRP